MHVKTDYTHSLIKNYDHSGSEIKVRINYVYFTATNLL